MASNLKLSFASDTRFIPLDTSLHLDGLKEHANKFFGSKLSSPSFAIIDTNQRQIESDAQLQTLLLQPGPLHLSVETKKDLALGLDPPSEPFDNLAFKADYIELFDLKTLDQILAKSLDDVKRAKLITERIKTFCSDHQCLGIQINGGSVKIPNNLAKLFLDFKRGATPIKQLERIKEIAVHFGSPEDVLPLVFRAADHDLGNTEAFLNGLVELFGEKIPTEVIEALKEEEKYAEDLRSWSSSKEDIKQLIERHFCILDLPDCIDPARKERVLQDPVNKQLLKQVQEEIKSLLPDFRSEIFRLVFDFIEGSSSDPAWIWFHEAKEGHQELTVPDRILEITRLPSSSLSFVRSVSLLTEIKTPLGLQLQRPLSIPISLRNDVNEFRSFASTFHLSQRNLLDSFQKIKQDLTVNFSSRTKRELVFSIKKQTVEKLLDILEVVKDLQELKQVFGIMKKAEGGGVPVARILGHEARDIVGMSTSREINPEEFEAMMLFSNEHLQLFRE